MKPIVLAILGGAGILWLLSPGIKNETVIYPAGRYGHADTLTQAVTPSPAYHTGITTGTTHTKEDQLPVNSDQRQTGSSRIATAGQWGLVSSILLILSFTPGGDDLFTHYQ